MSAEGERALLPDAEDTQAESDSGAERHSPLTASEGGNGWRRLYGPGSRTLPEVM